MTKYIDVEQAIESLKARFNDDGKTEYGAFWHHKAVIETLENLPSADVIAKTEYDKLLTAAKAMHTWIFLNTIDEFEAYDECGLTDEMNALLGSMGNFKAEIIEAEVDDDER